MGTFDFPVVFFSFYKVDFRWIGFMTPVPVTYTGSSSTLCYGSILLCVWDCSVFLEIFYWSHLNCPLANVLTLVVHLLGDLWGELSMWYILIYYNDPLGYGPPPQPSKLQTRVHPTTTYTEPSLVHDTMTQGIQWVFITPRDLASSKKVEWSLSQRGNVYCSPSDLVSDPDRLLSALPVTHVSR